KFIMEVKKIRDDRYYKELGFNTFEEYCQKVWGFERSWVYKKIQAASKLSETDFVDFNQQFGQQKTFLLATMEDEQRKQATEKGIPTKEGYKSIDKATQKEIAEYRKNTDEAIQKAEQAERRAEQAEQQNETERKEHERLERKNEELANVETEIIEKEVIKEIDKTDYERVKYLEEQIKMLDKRYEYLSNEDEKEKELKHLNYESNKSVLTLKLAIDEFLKDYAINTFRKGAIASAFEPTRERLQEGVDEMKDFFNEIEVALSGRIDLTKQEAK